MLFRGSQIQKYKKYAITLIFVVSMVLCLLWIHMWVSDNSIEEYKNPIDVFVASVHAAKFGNPKRPHAVFLNTMLPDTLQSERLRQRQMRFQCISDSNEVADPYIHSIDGGGDCSWKNYYFICEFRRPARSIQLVDSQGFGPKVPVKQPIQGKIPLVVCLSRTFYYENWQVMLTVLEMYKAMGVSEFSIHILNIVKQVYDVLKAYENEINLKIHPGFMIPKIHGRRGNPNSYTETINQIMCYNDCFFNYREAADFLIFSDMDDLITPENGDLLGKARQLLQHHPRAASFEFPWATSNFTGVASVTQYSIPRLLSGVGSQIEPYGKSIVIPKRIYKSIIHNAAHETVRLPEHPDINAKRNRRHGLALHLREMHMATFEDKLEYDKTADRVNSTLVHIGAMKRAEKTFRGRMNGTFKEAFESLPANNFFTEQFRQCYIHITNLRHMGKRVCASLNNCEIDYKNSPRCVAVTAEYEGHLNGRLNFYISKNLRIVEKENCQLDLANPVLFERKVLH